MVNAQRSNVHASLQLAEGVQDRPGVASIGTEHRVPIKEHAAARGSTIARKNSFRICVIKMKAASALARGYLPQTSVILEYLLVGQFLMQQIVAVVQVLRDLAVELLDLLDRLGVDVALVQLKVLLEANCRGERGKG